MTGTKGQLQSTGTAVPVLFLAVLGLFEGLWGPSSLSNSCVNLEICTFIFLKARCKKGGSQGRFNPTPTLRTLWAQRLYKHATLPARRPHAPAPTGGSAGELRPQAVGVVRGCCRGPCLVSERRGARGRRPAQTRAEPKCRRWSPRRACSMRAGSMLPTCSLAGRGKGTVRVRPKGAGRTARRGAMHARPCTPLACAQPRGARPCVRVAVTQALALAGRYRSHRP